jgi:hypothetical protein
VHTTLHGYDGWTSPSWVQRIDHAMCIDDVMCITREFVAALDYTAVARLPVACVPPRLIQSEDDVAAYAYDVLRLREEMAAESAPLLERIGDVFARASVRISQLNAYGARRASGAFKSSHA